MTLPASGLITMGQVKTELSISQSTALTLTDARVRTLFGVPSGVIKLTDGYSKSASPPLQWGVGALDTITLPV